MPLLLALLGCTPNEPTDPQACPPPPVGAGEVRVRQLACEADLPTGEFVAARVGDWVLENSTARFVVRDGPEGHALVGLTGGNLVDAVRMADGQQLGEDGLREWGTAVGFHVLAPDSFDASDDDLTITGSLVPFPLVTDILSVPRPSATVRWQYVIQPDEPVLEARAHLDGPAAPLADILLVRGGHQLFVPGQDPWDLPVSTQASSVGVLSSDPELGPAIATTSTGDRSLLYAGPIRLVLTSPSTGTVSKRIALGADHAEAAGWLDPARPRVPNQGGIVELRDADGAMLTRCRSDSCPEPAGTVEQVPVWLGDGNGGPGGPGQQGVPAELHLTAPTGFRATAIRDDGLERYLVDVDGDGTFQLPAGSWQVTVTAGPTHTIDTQTVELVAGESRAFEATVRQVVDTTGWSAADMHVHMETSLDSDMRIGHRIAGAIAEGLDYVVTTDHDFVATPPVAPPGLNLRAAAEVSTMTAGHFNAWPVVPTPDRAGVGAADWGGLGVDDLVAELPGLVQCNHPRFVDGGYAASFEIGLAPSHCDLVEVLNGFSPVETPVVLQDLTQAWAAGHRPVATGASDSHGEDDFVGNPRTWIRALGDADALDAALGDGLAVASGGPFVTLQLTSAGSSAAIGETLTATGEVTAHVHLQAPDWMELGELVLVVDGEEVWSEDLTGTAVVDGLKEHLALVGVTPDTYVAVVHRGAPATPGVTHVPPDVVTNPVWVD